MYDSIEYVKYSMMCFSVSSLWQPNTYELSLRLIDQIFVTTKHLLTLIIIIIITKSLWQPNTY